MNEPEIPSTAERWLARVPLVPLVALTVWMLTAAAIVALAIWLVDAVTILLDIGDILGSVGA